MNRIENMLNFAVGPVMSPQSILDISAESSPYFRTVEFSQMMLESERLVLDLLNAPEGSRCVFLTASGTGAMEAAVADVLRPDERVAVINGGSFGERFAQLSRLHKHDTVEIAVEFGRQVDPHQLDSIPRDCSALLVNMHETSSGVLYNMPLIGEFCSKRGMLLIVDAISSFIADDLDMAFLHADVVLTGSQKALACHPGVSIVAMSPRAVDRVISNQITCMYLSLQEALVNAERGQTPWTPAVTTMIELHSRLESISASGISSERSLVASRAYELREALASTRLMLVAECPSNAVSAFWCPEHNAHEVVEVALSEYGIWLCPNGGKYADDVFRVGHIGAIRPDDADVLLESLRRMHRKGLF